MKLLLKILFFVIAIFFTNISEAKLVGQENTFRAVLNAANGKLPASGVFNNIPVNVGGQTIFLRGNVIDGIPRLGTMFIK